MYKTNMVAHAHLINDYSTMQSLSRKARDKNLDLSDQKDLMGIESILVSTGINRNEDVFLRRELIPVHNTGAHKPMNLEHDSDRIVGHMIETFMTSKAGKRIKDDIIPKNFDITNRAVFYQYLFPDLADAIREQANSGELFVSVEMWFNDYDYLVGNKIVKRNSATAEKLDDLLRVNGGNGTFEGQRLGRVLRDLLIGGIGLVQTPANPESVIKSVSSLETVDVYNIEDKIISEHVLKDVDYISVSSKREEKMSIVDEITKEVTEVAKASAETKEEKEDKVEASTEEQKVEETKEDTLESVLAEIKELRSENSDLRETVKTLANERKVTLRRQALRDLGVSDKTVEETLEKCLEMSEAEFNTFVAQSSILLKDKVVEDKVEEKPEEKVEAEDKTEEITDTETAEETKEEKSESKNEEEELVLASVESDEDVLTVADILPTDQQINLESNDKEVDSFVKQFESVLNPILKSRNPKWGEVEETISV